MNYKKPCTGRRRELVLSEIRRLAIADVIVNCIDNLVCGKYTEQATKEYLVDYVLGRIDLEREHTRVKTEYAMRKAEAKCT